MKKVKVKEIRPILQFLITCVIALPFIILLSIDRFIITDIQSFLDYLLRCVLSTILIVTGFECFYRLVDVFIK